MAILVIAEHDNAVLKSATLTTLGAAAKLGGEVHLLVAGADLFKLGAAASQVAGVAKVLLADHEAFARGLPENLAPLVAGLAKKGYSHVLAPATSAGKNLAPRVAALLDVAQISEVIQLITDVANQTNLLALNATKFCSIKQHQFA